MKKMFNGFSGIFLTILGLLYVVSALWIAIGSIKKNISGFSLMNIFISLLLIALVLFLPVLIGTIIAGFVMNSLGERLGIYAWIGTMLIITYVFVCIAVYDAMGIKINSRLTEFPEKILATNLF